MIFIYGLVDPRTSLIRYIGKSVRPEGRLTDHCNDQSVTWRTNWIRDLKSHGLKPELTILHELPDDADWQTSEREWISKGRELGWPLTNCTDGGDGAKGLPPESRQRIIRAWIGRKHKDESLVKIGQASRGRHHTDEHKQHMSDLMRGRDITWIDKISKSLNKLTDEQVIEIRSRLANGENQYRLAEEYGVHQGTISNIKRRKCYTHIPKETQE